MFLFLYRLRFLFFLTLVVAVAGTIGYFMYDRTFEQDLERFNLQVTAGVATAVHEAVLSVTRTAEAPQHRFRLVQLADPDDLEAVAETYGTTLEILQIVNGFSSDITEGHGEIIVVPVDLTVLEPPRQIVKYTAQPGDTLSSLAEANSLSLDLIQADNPVLAQRGVQSGDIIFIALVF